MPLSTYARDLLGSARIDPIRQAVAGSHASFDLTYTAGRYGIDDTGGLRIVQRFASDMGEPQFKDPAAANYVTVAASNGAVLDCRWDVKGNIRPWDKTLFIKVVRGFLKEGERIVVRFGDPSGGSPGMRMQTFCEDSFELKVLVDAFATYDFAELPASPALKIVAGAAARWTAVIPTIGAPGEPFALRLRADDRWGNPAPFGRTSVGLRTGAAVAGLPERLALQEGDCTATVEGLSVSAEAELVIDVAGDDGSLLARSNPMRVLPPHSRRAYWADLHGQSEETIGTNSAGDYFRFGRDRAFLDAIGHQGNDFQITRGFWSDLQGLVKEFDAPGRCAVFLGYEWSGNTGLGGDHNVIFLHPNGRIRRSSHALVADLSDAADDCPTARDLYRSLEGAEAFLIAHVGGRYADLAAAAEHGVMPAVEIHSAWGTFPWLLHDAFRLGLRPGIVANSDDHKGRPGASHPGASRFGCYGGLTCFLARELTREAIFECLRERRHYATTGARILLHAAALSPDGAEEALMGQVLTTRARRVRFRVDALCPAPVERIEAYNGEGHVATVRPFGPAQLGRRIRVMWEGAEYRGRGRETVWDGSLRVEGNTVEGFTAINFWNAEKTVRREPDGALSWRSLTTGGSSGIEVSLGEPASGRLRIDTPLVRCSVEVAAVGLEDTVFEAGGLERRVRIYRLPDRNPVFAFREEFDMDIAEGRDNPVYARVVLEDGHAAWSSPIYIAAG
jgi:hypothetical protein